MPEATMDKERLSKARKYKVGSTGEILALKAEAEA